MTRGLLHGGVCDKRQIQPESLARGLVRGLVHGVGSAKGLGKSRGSGERA